MEEMFSIMKQFDFTLSSVIDPTLGLNPNRSLGLTRDLHPLDNAVQISTRFYTQKM